jgi:hypothetical protein
MLLDSGASLKSSRAEGGIESSLRVLHETAFNCSWHWFAPAVDRDRWLVIVGMFLKHGAVEQTSAEQWDEVYVDACSKAGNRDYCERLDQAWPVRKLQSSILLRMLREAVKAGWMETRLLSGRSPWGLDLIRWVFTQCVEGKGRTLPLKLELRRLIEETDKIAEARIVGDLLRELLKSL